ncbi:hypothetical protein KAU11_09145, partial [Candidatus Babeliales bacterium]|nr:hypothetical protein [Candidatus Babeliales bacterium]
MSKVSKKCSVCLKTRLFKFFGINKGGKYGLRSQCKTCVNNIAKNHIDKVKRAERKHAIHKYRMLTDE